MKARPGAPSGGAPRGLVEFSPIVVSAPDAGGARDLHGSLLLRDLDLDVGTRLEEVRGRLDVAALRIGEDPRGRAALRLQTVRVAGLLLESLEVPLRWRDGILTAAPLSASLYGGRLAGEVRVHTREPFALEGRLDVEGLSLERLMGDVGGGPEIRGDAALHVEFQSRSSSFSDFTAAGTAKVSDGDLGNLPPIANLPALFSSFFPVQTKPRFERAEVDFTILDERIRADRLRLSGPLFDLDGFGTLTFSGSLDLTLTPQFLKSMLLPGSLQLPGARELLGLLREDSLYVVRVRGDLADGQARPRAPPLPRRPPQGARLPGHALRRAPRAPHAPPLPLRHPAGAGCLCCNPGDRPPPCPGLPTRERTDGRSEPSVLRRMQHAPHRRHPKCARRSGASGSSLRRTCSRTDADRRRGVGPRSPR